MGTPKSLHIQQATHKAPKRHTRTRRQVGDDALGTGPGRIHRAGGCVLLYLVSSNVMAADGLSTAALNTSLRIPKAALRAAASAARSSGTPEAPASTIPAALRPSPSKASAPTPTQRGRVWRRRTRGGRGEGYVHPGCTYQGAQTGRASDMGQLARFLGRHSSSAPYLPCRLTTAAAPPGPPAPPQRGRQSRSSAPPGRPYAGWKTMQGLAPAREGAPHTPAPTVLASGGRSLGTSQASSQGRVHRQEAQPGRRGGGDVKW
jgi:hypothetical protein